MTAVQPHRLKEHLLAFPTEPEYVPVRIRIYCEGTYKGRSCPQVLVMKISHEPPSGFAIKCRQCGLETVFA